MRPARAPARSAAAPRPPSTTSRTAAPSPTRSSAASRSTLPRDGVDVDAAGTAVRLFDADGRTVATWRKDGHTCVLSGEDVGGEQLAALAGSTSAY